ncbi:MAG: Gfo/Idh/MocA family oxidoreductase [Opitutaceae bacterium]|nr:Gfo/Idh/MocA family oxidoreductase [Opitutaceae bacterium]
MKTSKTMQFSRRRFLGGTAAALAAAATSKAFGRVEGAPGSPRRIKLGVIGNGGRGAWIAKLFQDHGGYEIWAVADYFKEVADKCGDALGVERSRRFSTLSGYRRLLESGVEAVAVETPPYFMPEQVTESVEAGLHVYMAKPVAVDVPGALKVAEAGRRASARAQCFLVDYQIPTDPVNIEVARRIRDGGLGRIARVLTNGQTRAQKDPPRTATMESRLRDLIWVNDVAMGCDYIGNYDIHAIDAALWVLGSMPVAAMGASGIYRPDAHGDSRDMIALTYEYAEGFIHQHTGSALSNNRPGDISATFEGTVANAFVSYKGNAFLRGGPRHFGGGAVENLYAMGATRNIDRFHKEISSGVHSNDTCQRAVDGVLACVLGYEAGARHGKLTMDALLRENRRLEVDLRGLKA